MTKKEQENLKSELSELIKKYNCKGFFCDVTVDEEDSFFIAEGKCYIARTALKALECLMIELPSEDRADAVSAIGSLAILQAEDNESDSRETKKEDKE